MESVGGARRADSTEPNEPTTEAPPAEAAPGKPSRTPAAGGRMEVASKMAGASSPPVPVGPGQTWNDAVKSFFERELAQGELDNDLATVARKDLSPALKKAYDEVASRYADGSDEPVTVYKIDEVGGKTAYAITMDNDAAFNAELYNASGKLIARGSGRGGSIDWS
jgi:hypothetical protein